MRKLSTGTGAQSLRPYLKHDDVEVKPSLLGLYSVMGTLEPLMEVNFKLCQGSKCNQSVDFLKWHQISEGDRLISTITFWRSKQTLSREEEIREFHDFSFSSTISRPRFQPNLKETSLIFKLINEMIRLEFLFERKQSIYIWTGNVDGVDPPNSTFVNLNLNSWKDWIMKLLVLWFIRGFFQDELDGKDTRLSSIHW